MELFWQQRPDYRTTLIPDVSLGAPPGSEPSLSGALDFNTGYGCWCNFIDYTYGQGKAVDHMDRSCKRLHDNYKCIEEEFKMKFDDVCKPSEIDYDPGMIYTYLSEAIYAKVIYGENSEEARIKKGRFEFG